MNAAPVLSADLSFFFFFFNSMILSLFSHIKVDGPMEEDKETKVLETEFGHREE